MGEGLSLQCVCVYGCQSANECSQTSSLYVGGVSTWSACGSVSECVSATEKQVGLTGKEVKWPGSQGCGWVSKRKAVRGTGFWSQLLEGPWSLGVSKGEISVCVYVCVFVSV